MRKILKRKLPFLLVLAMIAGLLPVWTVPVKAAAETTISEDTTYNATYHISDDTTLYIAKGVTYSADSFCFDGNYTLTVRGAGTLETGDITTTSSAVIYSLAIESGRFTAQNINCGYGSKIFINGGSVKMNNIFPYTSLSLSDGSPVYSAIITVAGLHAITDVTYSVDGGSTIESSTDENGKLYLWLTNGSHIITVSDGTINYSAWISTEKNSWSNATASPVAVNIDTSTTTGSCAFKVGNGARVNLTLSGSSTLKSSNCNAGLSAETNTMLTISEDSTTAAIDSLTAIGGKYGAEIGDGYGVSGHSCGKVAICGGTVNAYGGVGSAGIGGGYGGHGSGGSGGNVIIYGGTVKAAGNSDGYDTPADIGHGTGTDGNGGDGSVTIIGGSVSVNDMGPSIVYYDVGQTPAYLTTITVGADPVKSQDVTYTLDGGQKSAPCSTDENGLLYLWLPESSSTIADISAVGTVYEAAGAVTTVASSNARTALMIPKIITPPTASGIYSGSTLSSSILTGGAVTGVNSVALAGTFTWTDPAAIVSSSGSYSVTFIPDD